MKKLYMITDEDGDERGWVPGTSREDAIEQFLAWYPHHDGELEATEGNPGADELRAWGERLRLKGAELHQEADQLRRYADADERQSRPQ